MPLGPNICFSIEVQYIWNFMSPFTPMIIFTGLWDAPEFRSDCSDSNCIALDMRLDRGPHMKVAQMCNKKNQIWVTWGQNIRFGPLEHVMWMQAKSETNCNTYKIKSQIIPSEAGGEALTLAGWTEHTCQWMLRLLCVWGMNIFTIWWLKAPLINIWYYCTYWSTHKYLKCKRSHSYLYCLSPDLQVYVGFQTLLVFCCSSCFQQQAHWSCSVQNDRQVKLVKKKQKTKSEKARKWP